MDVNLGRIRFNYALTVFISIGLCQSTIQAQGSSPESSRIRTVGRYACEAYGYSVRVPNNLVAYRDPAPAPQHGIQVHSTEGVVWTNGEFDAQLLGSTEASAANTAQQLAELYDLRRASSGLTKLDGLDALDVVLQSDKGSGQFAYARFILAYRPIKSGIGIVYTIGVREHLRTKKADAIFLAIVKSFRLVSMSESRLGIKEPEGH